MQEVTTHRQRSRAYLEKAGAELEAGDLEQASEKAWGAAALMVKAVAEQRGEFHKGHNAIGRFTERLSEELEDDDISDLFGMAEGLHINFYENRFAARTVRRRLRSVEQFVEKMGRLLEPTR